MLGLLAAGLGLVVRSLRAYDDPGDRGQRALR
jgi:hypothetical protein